MDALIDGVDVVTASPYHPDGRVEGVGGFRLLMSKAASRVYRMRLGGRARGLTAFTCGFRAYRRTVLPEMD